MTATLVVKTGMTDKKEYHLEPGRTYFIGRARDAHIIVKDGQASRRHCSIQATPDGKWAITDLESSNGTYVNRQRTTTRPLKDGDVIQVGKSTFEFCLRAAATPAAEPEALAVGPEDVRAKAEPDAQAQEPQPVQAPKPDASDRDLQDLFQFLDKLEAGERPAAKEEPKATRNDRSVPHEPPPVTPPPKPDRKEEAEPGPLFSLLEKAEPIPETQPEPPREEKKTERKGGLLSFLRKKKQP